MPKPSQSITRRRETPFVNATFPALQVAEMVIAGRVKANAFVITARSSNLNHILTGRPSLIYSISNWYLMLHKNISEQPLYQSTSKSSADRYQNLVNILDDTSRSRSSVRRSRGAGSSR